MKGEKEERQILGVLLSSELTFWEQLGMLENIKFQLSRMTYGEADKKSKSKDKPYGE